MWYGVPDLVYPALGEKQQRNKIEFTLLVHKHYNG